MAIYRTKPERVEAARFYDTPESLAELHAIGMDKVFIERSGFRPRLVVFSFSAKDYAEIGDYIVKSPRGHFFSCKPEEFEKRHKLLEPPMTDEHAILILKNRLHYGYRYDDEDDPDNEAFKRAITAITTLNERMTPMPARREIAQEPTKSVNGGIFGKGCAIWFCPKCNIFNTPAHSFCWKCGQALSFDIPDTRAGGRAGEEQNKDGT